MKTLLIMKKEALFAIIIGVLLGLGITYGIYRFSNQNARSPVNSIEQATITPSPTPSSEKLLITSPKDGSVLSDTNLRMSGTAESNEMIVIFVNNNEYFTKADDIGAFAQDLQLDNGGNRIEVTAINQSGNQKVVTLDVVVSTASLEETAPVASDSAKTEEDDEDADTTPTPTPKGSARPSPAQEDQ